MVSGKGLDWRAALEAVDYAFQPIVNIHTGVVYGYEALIRHVDHAGFASIAAFFDSMHQQGVLGDIHRQLLIKARRKFHQLSWADQAKLFYNIDGRLFGADYAHVEPDLVLLPELSIPKGAVCLEISEQHAICNPDLLVGQLKRFRAAGCRIAVDDFGTGFAGTHILYFARPEYVKIDRFYIQHIERDTHKRRLAASMVDIAHLMGSLVVAEGVETAEEYYCCKTIGCDLLQGYLVQKPELKIRCLQKSYEAVQQLSDQDRRNKHNEDESLIQAETEYIEPIRHDAQPIAILEAFKKNKKNTFIPVTNRNNEALGIIREETVKEYAYSEFGRYLLVNPTAGQTIDDFISRIPIVDIHTPVEKILNSFMVDDDLEGIIITNCLKYVGILRAQSLLRIVNEKKLAAAIDQNPLSKLPGNKLIYEYVSKALQDNSQTYVIVYFDFDNFKVYNDKYGFRQGDRVILLFAELLKARAQLDNRFVGHIGGDDFVMGVQGAPLDTVVEEIVWIGEKFSSSVESFYDAQTLRKGCLKAVGRDGQHKCFPLMTISSAVMELPAGTHRIYSPEEIGKIMAQMKKKAKRSPDRLCVATLKHCAQTTSRRDANAQANTIIELSHHRLKTESA